MSFANELRPFSPAEVLKASGETTVHRYGPSHPARILVENSLVTGPIFDWGCGHGYDLKYFRQHGLDCDGWDPVHRPETPPSEFLPDIFSWVHCAFVLNTLPCPRQRQKILTDIYHFLPPSGHLSLTVRSQAELASQIKSNWYKSGDGWITSRGTFQRGFLADELFEMLSPLYSSISVVSKKPIFVIAEK